MTPHDYDPLDGDGAENVPWPFVSGSRRRVSGAAALSAALAVIAAVAVFSRYVAPWIAEVITR